MDLHPCVIVEGLVRAPKRKIIVDVTTQFRDKTVTSPIDVNRVLKKYDGRNVKITIELVEEEGPQ